jgi:hypothetical protein
MDCTQSVLGIKELWKDGDAARNHNSMCREPRAMVVVIGMLEK